MTNSSIADLCNSEFGRTTYPRRRRHTVATCCVIGLIVSVFAAPAAYAQAGTESAPPSTSGPTMGPMNKDQLEMGPMSKDPLVMAARFEECRLKLQEERSVGLITALRIGATAIEVDVDSARWKPMPFNNKLAVVETVSCYGVAGNPKLHARVQVLDNLDHHSLGNYDGSALKLP
jgi:hypothetical protein